ncbi:MAG: ABC transporter permease [Chloroflexota bacterium]|nr:ABC transporter permease [Chloroflexota bacterium]
MLIVLEKEWLELRLQRTLLLATFFLPPLITAFAVVGFFFVGKFTASTIGSAAPLPPEFASLSQFELGQAILGRQFSTLFLLVPIFIPSVLASYAIVGEKRERTLEPVLATPIRTWELLLGKILGALVPALAITLASAAVFVVGILSFAVSDRVRAMIVTPGWVLAVLVDTPLLALIGVALIVVLSSRVNDPRTAQQISAVLVVPVVGLLFGQLAGVIVLSPPLALGIGVVLAIVAAGALWAATRLFQREVILTRWR